ncbi:MAG: hypothetical protein C0631_04050 [Sedimenticola sp.]|nr:MAG: hypothetical protein C0631_04050 [Sedimenticola sp.]
MIPIRKGQLKNVIHTACVVRLDTGEKQLLSTKGDSYCHFFKPISIEDYNLQLRLDWSDLDAGGHPTLDADFYDVATNKKLRNTGELRPLHHTQTNNPSLRVYEWEFRGYKWPFKVIISWLVIVKESIQVTDSVSCEVFRNDLKVDE